MRRTFAVTAALFAGLTLTAAGCGGSKSGGGEGGGSVPASASLIPASAPLYVAVNTDFDGDQWQQLDALLAKFPDRAQALAQLQTAMQEHGAVWSDIKAALGPDTAFAATAFTDDASALALTKSADQAALDALIKKLDESDPSPGTKQREIDGWTVVSDSDAILAAAQKASDGTSLADSEALKDTFAELPSDALVRVFAEGHSIANAVQAQGGAAAPTAEAFASLKSVGAALTATEDGLELETIAKGPLGIETFSPQLLSDVPDDALVYAGFANLGSQISKLSKNPQLALGLAALGVTPEQLGSLFGGEGALFVRPGSPLPEVTLILAPDDAASAIATLDKLASTAALALGTTVQPVTVGGAQAKKLSVQGVPVYFANVDGKIVVTNSEAGITGLSSGGDSLADSETYKEATEAAGVPDEVTGILYVNIKDTVPLIDSFSSIAGSALPPEATANLEHLRAFVAYGTVSDETNTVKAFLQIK